jgi:hypothetical protein
MNPHCGFVLAGCACAILLAAYVDSPAQAIPKPGEQFGAISMDGMWTWYGEPKAVYYEGVHKRTYMCWNTRNGDKGVGWYDHETGDTFTAFAPHMPYNGSDHNHPSIIMRPDGRMLIFCTGHDGGEVTEYITKNPEDITSWDGPYYPGGKGGYCYCNAIFLKNEGTKGRFYIFYRDNTQYTGETTNYCPAFCTSDDWGVTWSSKTRLYTYAGSAYKPYLKYASDGLSTIHICIEFQNREGDGKTRPVYYMKYNNETFYNADNSVITTIDKLPVINTQLDTIFYAYTYGAGGSNTCCDIAYDASNNPVLLFCSFQSTTLYEYWYERWTGSSWFKRPLINSGAYRGAQSGFFAGLTFDHENPNNIYMCRQLLKPAGTPFDLLDTSTANYKNLKSTAWVTVDTVHELDRWTTSDGGVTWDSLAITRGSLNKNMLPCVPRNHKPNMKIDCMWLNGVYTAMSSDGYDCAVRVFPWETGESLPTTSVQPQYQSTFAPRGMVCTRAGITFSLINPEKASCKVYSLNGKLSADLTSLVRSMNAGSVTIPFSNMHLSRAVYLVDLDNGNTRTVGSFIATK